MASSVLSKSNECKGCVCCSLSFSVFLFCFTVVYNFIFFLRVKASLHLNMNKQSNPSCLQRNGRRNGSKVRQTTWGWTHLTISRESLIPFSNKEGMKQDINRALTISPQVFQQNTVKQVVFFLPTCFSTRNELSLSPYQQYPLHTPKAAPFKWAIKS